MVNTFVAVHPEPFVIAGGEDGAAIEFHRGQERVRLSGMLDADAPRSAVETMPAATRNEVNPRACSRRPVSCSANPLANPPASTVVDESSMVMLSQPAFTKTCLNPMCDTVMESDSAGGTRCFDGFSPSPQRSFSGPTVMS